MVMPDKGGNRTRVAEFRESRFRANPVGVIAEEDLHRGRGIGTDSGARSEGGRCRGRLGGGP